MEEKILERIYDANTRVLKELGKALREVKNITPSDYYTIRQSMIYGTRLEKIEKIIGEALGLTTKETRELLEEYAKNDYDFSEVYYKAKNKEYLKYEDNIALKSKVDNIVRASNRNGINMLRTTGLTYLNREGKKVTKPVVEAYQEIVNQALDNIITGRGTFESEIEKQLTVLGRYGLQSIEFSSGRHRRLDTQLRMNINDSVNQLQIEQQKVQGEQFGSDGVEISVHEFPAIDHADLQGQQFSNEQFEILNSGGQAKTYNGKTIYADGHRREIGIYNCRHIVYSIVLGVTKPNYTQEELDKIKSRNEAGFEYEGRHYTYYEGTQLQRNMETRIRQIKDEITINEAYGTQEGNNRANVLKERLGIYITKYHELCNVSGLKSYYERIRTYK